MPCSAVLPVSLSVIGLVAISKVATAVAAEKTEADEAEVSELRAKLDKVEAAKTETGKDKRKIALQVIGAILVLLATSHFKDILAWLGSGLN